MLSEVQKENEAFWNAMPPPRLLDGGMLYSDVLKLQQATADSQEWNVAAKELGAEQRQRGKTALAEGNTETALGAFRAAVADFLFAQMPLADTQQKKDLYASARSALNSITEIPTARLTRYEVPFSNGHLVGWLSMPKDPVATVIIFGGQSGWGATYYRMADALNARRVAAFMVEGPGQGESRLFSNIYLDVDVAAAFSRFVDTIETIPELSDRPVGIWGNSIGGSFAARTSAADHRITATVINGGFATPRLLPFRTFKEQAAAMLGTDDQTALEDNFKRLAFDASKDRFTGGVLVVHGGQDPLVKPEDQSPFMEASKDATWMEWPTGDHTIYNHHSERSDAVADWLVSRLSKQA